MDLGHSDHCIIEIDEQGKVTHINCEITQLKAEVERLNADIEKIGTQDDPMWVEACRLKTEVERLTGLYDTAITAGNVIKEDRDKISDKCHGVTMNYLDADRERVNLKAEVERLIANPLDRHLYKQMEGQVARYREALEEMVRVFEHEFEVNVIDQALAQAKVALKGRV